MLTLNKAFENRNALYIRHLQLYGQYVPALLELYERHCPGYCAILILAFIEQDLFRILNRFKLRWCSHLASSISPIVHPRQWGPHDPKLTRIWLEPRVHSLLLSILASQVPQIRLETASSCLHYLQSGGHSVKSRKSLKPLPRSSYFTRLKMRPSLSRFRKRRHCYSSWHCLLEKQDLRSTWWGNNSKRPHDYNELLDKKGVRVPFRYFSYRSEYASNYDLWYTYQYSLLLLPIFLANSPPDSHLASIATNCIFSSFCTAYPLETREAKKSILHYVSRCRPIRALSPKGRIVVNDMNAMDVL